MSDPDDTMDLAKTGDTLHGADLQASIDALLAMARSLDESIASATEVDEIQAIGAAQSRLNDQAMALVTAQVSLLAGQVRVTADHINAAAQYAADALATMADWKKRITTMGKVVDFFGVVMTGNGAKILEAAVKLKGALK